MLGSDFQGMYHLRIRREPFGEFRDSFSIPTSFDARGRAHPIRSKFEKAKPAKHFAIETTKLLQPRMPFPEDHRVMY